MKVLMGAGYYEVGGFKVVLERLAKALEELGVDVTLAFRVMKTSPESPRITKMSPRGFASEAKRHDAVHVHLSYPYIKALMKAGHRNFVVTHHGYTPWYHVTGMRWKLVNLYLKFAYKSILRRITLLTAVSNYVKEQLRKTYGVDAYIVSNGVDTSLFKPFNSLDKGKFPIVLNSTGSDPKKGISRLLRDFSRIKKCYPDALLMVHGLDFGNFSVSHLLRKEGLRPSKDVKALPFMPYEDLPYYYGLADVYLLTSKFESFGLPIIESFACGTPVIALDRDDARREHIQASGAGHLYYDSESLLKSLDDVLKNRYTYSKRAVRYTRNFDWHAVGRQYVNLYDRCLEE